MKFSYNWLQTYFDTPLPSVESLAETITFHSSEIEELLLAAGDTVLDVKVLPDKSAWLMSHRGMAKELSVILGVPMKSDPLASAPVLPWVADKVRVTLDTPTCDYYGAALIRGVKVGPTPDWLRVRLEAIGQRSINNIVDATNYVMFGLGQPLHAFDADTLGVSDVGAPHIHVRTAVAGEKFTTLSREERVLTTADAVITDGVTGRVLALAGVKGGLDSGVTENTTTILLESAHFERVAIRKSAQRHKLPTDAAKRYENGLSRAIAPYGLAACATLIAEIAGGEVVEVASAGDASEPRADVSVSLTKINSVLGIALTLAQVTGILDRFGYHYEVAGDIVAVTPPVERDDLVVAEDLIEEIGRIHGLSNIVSIPPTATPLQEMNVRHYYADKIRTVLAGLGFSEVYTSSFRDKDSVHLKNALASDKSYLRSRLMENLTEVRERNIPHRDLLGLSSVQVFEIGTVFGAESEAFHLGLAVQTGTAYKVKVDDALLATAVTTLETALGVTLTPVHTAPGYFELSLDTLLPQLPVPTAYDTWIRPSQIIYKTFSVYPAVSRDIAMWVGEGTGLATVESILRSAAGPLLARLTHLDTFTKDGKTSLAFRLVFQSNEKTLDGAEVDELMKAVYSGVLGQGFEAR
jgi:phenylalanyl-tRNA synthetase beta chain